MAIARDGAGVNGSSNTGTTLTWAHTVNGPNPVLWVFARVFSSTITLTATYNGVAMINPTNAIFVDAGNGVTLYIFGLAGQTGTNNVVVTASSSATITGLSMAFSGADQTALTGSNQPDASGNKTQSNSTQIDNTLTTVAANVWMVLAGADFTGPEPNAAAGSTKDIGDGGSTGIYSNGPYATPGSNTISYTPTGFHVVDGVFASFAPAGESTVSASSLVYSGSGPLIIRAGRVQ